MIALTPYTLFISQVVAHLATIWWIYQSPSVIEVLTVFVIYFITGCIGMTITYHRLLTHRSFKTSKFFEYLGTLCATVGLTGSSLSWTAAHRQHHARADRPGDPHSPHVGGYIRAHWGSMFSPINIQRSPVIDSEFHRWIHRHYFTVNLIYGFVLLLIGGLNAVFMCWLIPAAVLWNAGSLINTMCHTHWLGYKNYRLADQSVNNPVLGILMWGEGWHNNHHRFQNRPNIGERWWEIDIGWWIIKLIKAK
jgi:stearoyl-CoA desaturase (delta-9 desaturase)